MFLRVKLRVRKRIMDKVKDVWDCLDIMEKRFLDLVDVGLLEIIDDFIKGMVFFWIFKYYNF